MQGNERREIGYGVILSYVLIILNAIYGLFMTPFILRYVGSSAYGVYKSVSSISASLAIMDLGLGTTTTRYMARYNATDDKEGANTFLGMMLTQMCILGTAVIIIGLGMVIGFPLFYQEGFSPEEMFLGRKMLIILVCGMSLQLLSNLLFGVLSGYQKFKFSNSIKILVLLTRITLLWLLLPRIRSVILIVTLNVFLSLADIFIFGLYILFKVRLHPIFKRWNRSLFKETMGYTSLMFVQSLTIQFNGNVDNILLGARIGTLSVTVYSMALTIFGMYENLSGSIANIMLPTVTKQVVDGAIPETLQKTVERAGRLQFLILAGALGGFFALGREFYLLWVGELFEDCYWLVLMLIIPVTFPMIQNVSLSILRAENKMVYRTVTLAIACLANVVMTLIGIQFWGYWGAAMGTGMATLLNLIMMNMYYHKILHFQVFKMFRNIMKGIIESAVIASVITAGIHRYLSGTWIAFAISAGVFVVVYMGMLILFGLQKEERIQLTRKFREGR